MGNRNQTPRATLAHALGPALALGIALALAGGLVLLLGSTLRAQESTVAPSRGSDASEMVMNGAVRSAPADPAGFGLWLIDEAATGQTYSVTAVSLLTEFPQGVPSAGDYVHLRGEWAVPSEPASIIADRIEIVEGPGERGPGSDDDWDGHDDGDLSGFLRARPDLLPPLGEWQIECEPSVYCTVIVSGTTQFEDAENQFTVGSWVEVDGARQGDGSLMAARVRLDRHERREIVARLLPDVTPALFATEYDLTHTATLLASANIHLFHSAVDEDDALEEILVDIESGVGALALWAEHNSVYTVPSDDGYKTWVWGGTDDDGYVNQGAFDQVALDDALTVSKGTGQIIAVLDTGVWPEHPAFQIASGGSLLLTGGWDFVADDALPRDEGPGFGWGHGTHVTGIVARVAPDARLLPLRVLDADGRGNTFTLAYAIQYAVAQGADVINLSLGADAGSLLLEETIAHALDAGVAVVAAAGNDAADAPIRYPAGFDGVLSVAAVTAENTRAPFSNYGDWVDTAAPGVGITSSVPFSGGLGYAAWSGTSMATAFVTGAAALVLAADANTAVPDAPAMSPADLTAVLLQSATPLPAGDQIGGLLHVARALGLPESPPPPRVRIYLPLVDN